VQQIDTGQLRQLITQLGMDGDGSQLPDALDHVVKSAKQFFSVSGAGIMFADDEHVLHYVAASDEGSRRLEDAQRRAGEGPCVDALVLDETVATSDVMRDERWPGLLDQLGDSDVRAVLGMPIHLAGAAVGSINLYRDEPYEWQPAEADGVASFAGLVERLFATALKASRQEELARQLQHALDHRVAIERAVGVIMARRSVDPPAAFETLRKLARDRRRPAFEVAAKILERRELP
jgi:GAF domain-containing protein